MTAGWATDPWPGMQPGAPDQYSVKSNYPKANSICSPPMTAAGALNPYPYKEGRNRSPYDNQVSKDHSREMNYS